MYTVVENVLKIYILYIHITLFKKSEKKKEKCRCVYTAMYMYDRRQTIASSSHFGRRLYIVVFFFLLIFFDGKVYNNFYFI